MIEMDFMFQAHSGFQSLEKYFLVTFLINLKEYQTCRSTHSKNILATNVLFRKNFARVDLSILNKFSLAN